MNRFKLTVHKLKVEGRWMQRGDIIELNQSVADRYGTKLELQPDVATVVEQKPRRGRRPKTVTEDTTESDMLDQVTEDEDI